VTLFYKAWRESRGRFLFAAGALVVFSVGFLISARSSFPPPEAPRLAYTAFVWGTFYGPFRALAFSVIALVLGLGGLQRERALGSAPFTLALPISRAQLVRVRALVGLGELAALALIPAAIIPALSPAMVRQTYPVTQSLQYGALFMSWGIVWFAVGFLWSVVFSGEYTAAVASVLSPWAYMVIYANVSRGGQRFPLANPFGMMSGDLGVGAGYNGRGLLTQPLPWAAMLALAAIAAGLLLAASRLTSKQSF
jgi:ABC-2 type transport system permease protein